MWDSEGGRLYIAPSAVQKDRLDASMIFQYALRPEQLENGGKSLQLSHLKTIAEPVMRLKPSGCSPLFLAVLQMHQEARAVVHSHSHWTNLATCVFSGPSLRISHQEMIKGIEGHGYLDILEIPIIENTPRESELEESLRAAMAAYPGVPAVLVRHHGVYVWGKTWEQAKTQVETVDYLCRIAVDLHKLGLPLVQPSAKGQTPPAKRARTGEEVPR
jgi:methylthioribulose-1-phosphate dehydratase